MSIIDVELLAESQARYLTYALSVVHNRALPDVRDGLKPVQRRILFAMLNNLNLTPDRPHRKSAAVVGEVLARLHPHGDEACYEAMVRMAQPFSLRYPLVDGQGNFGSLDGDGAAAYRYTEARLTALALEVLGDLDEETVAERDNFDQTFKEPVVLPTRVPNLLMNGASGIAVGMATAIPPHNLTELIKALQLLLEEPGVKDSKLLTVLKGPDFPTGCSVVITKAELLEIYRTGRGAIRMRADYTVEKGSRGKDLVVITSVPYGVDKSRIVEEIAELIIERKIPQLTDVRDESTDVVRVVLELSPGADAEKAMAYLYKNTPLQTNFNVNLTALIPGSNTLSARPAQLSLREMLEHFLNFRLEVTRRKLSCERRKLEARIHLLEGLATIADVLGEVMDIVRRSDGRSDAASKLQERFELSELQALFVVDLRIYQLSRTSIEEVTAELKQKRGRVREISRILTSEAALKGVIRDDLSRIERQYGDGRRSTIRHDVGEVEIRDEEFVEHEDVFVIVTRDGWVKRIRATNDPKNTRVREGDTVLFADKASTLDMVAFFSTFGNVFVRKVFDLPATSGFGDPVQKMFRFGDGEQVAGCLIVRLGQPQFREHHVLIFTEAGLGFKFRADALGETKRSGKRIARLQEGDRVVGVSLAERELVFLLSEQGYGLLFPLHEVPELTGPGKGVILKRLGKDDRIVLGGCVGRDAKIKVSLKNGTEREVSMRELTVASRAQKGMKVVQRGTPVTGVVKVMHAQSQPVLLH